MKESSYFAKVSIFMGCFYECFTEIKTASYLRLLVLPETMELSYILNEPI
jgi:hypothetical protein